MRFFSYPESKKKDEHWCQEAERDVWKTLRSAPRLNPHLMEVWQKMPFPELPKLTAKINLRSSFEKLELGRLISHQLKFFNEIKNPQEETTHSSITYSL